MLCGKTSEVMIAEVYAPTAMKPACPSVSSPRMPVTRFRLTTMMMLKLTCTSRFSMERLPDAVSARRITV